MAKLTEQIRRKVESYRRKKLDKLKKRHAAMMKDPHHRKILLRYAVVTDGVNNPQPPQ
jgi:hypothetical protein